MEPNEVKDGVLELEPKTAAVFQRKGYTILKKLNEGAFGQVFKGQNIKNNSLVAIKVMFIKQLGEKYTVFCCQTVNVLFVLLMQNSLTEQVLASRVGGTQKY